MEINYKPLNFDIVSTDTIKRTHGVDRKKGYALVARDRQLIKEHAHVLRDALFTCMTEEQVEVSVAFARYLSRCGLTAENYWLFLRLIMTNNPWVIDELIRDAEPRLLFSTILPDAELIEAAFQTLFSRHPGEIYPRALEALLGIIENAYFDPDDGYRIRKLTLMDINALGKFLLKQEPQEHPQNRLILDILDRMTHLNEYYPEPDKSVLSKHAFNVRYAYFDSTRNLIDAIPHPLLVHLSDQGKVPPAEDFVELVTKRRIRQRDARGRFVKEQPVSGESPGDTMPAADTTRDNPDVSSSSPGENATSAIETSQSTNPPASNSRKRPASNGSNRSLSRKKKT